MCALARATRPPAPLRDAPAASRSPPTAQPARAHAHTRVRLVCTPQPANFEHLADDAFKLWVQMARHSFALLASFEVEGTERCKHGSMLQKLVAEATDVLKGIDGSQGARRVTATASAARPCAVRPPRRALTRPPRHGRAGLGEFVEKHGVAASRSRAAEVRAPG